MATQQDLNKARIARQKEVEAARIEAQIENEKFNARKEVEHLKELGKAQREADRIVLDEQKKAAAEKIKADAAVRHHRAGWDQTHAKVAAELGINRLDNEQSGKVAEAHMENRAGIAEDRTRSVQSQEKTLEKIQSEQSETDKVLANSIHDKVLETEKRIVTAFSERAQNYREAMQNIQNTENQTLETRLGTVADTARTNLAAGVIRQLAESSLKLIALEKDLKALEIEAKTGNSEQLMKKRSEVMIEIEKYRAEQQTWLTEVAKQVIESKDQQLYATIGETMQSYGRAQTFAVVEQTKAGGVEKESGLVAKGLDAVERADAIKADLHNKLKSFNEAAKSDPRKLEQFLTSQNVSANPVDAPQPEPPRFGHRGS